MMCLSFLPHLTQWDDISLLIIKKLGYALLIYLTFLSVKRLIHWLFKAILGKKTLFTAQDIARQKTLSKLFLSLADYSLMFITFYGILATWGLPISSLLAGAGIAGLAIGLGAQGFLNDLINGMFILLERQYDVGDTVTIQNITGKVVNLGIRTTQLQSSDGTVHFIPNRNITYVSNQSRGHRRVQVDLPLAFEHNFEQITPLLQKASHTYLEPLPEVLEPVAFLGIRATPTGQTVFRVTILVENGYQETIYYKAYQLFQEQLQQAGLLKTVQPSHTPASNPSATQ